MKAGLSLDINTVSPCVSPSLWVLLSVCFSPFFPSLHLSLSLFFPRSSTLLSFIETFSKPRTQGSDLSKCRPALGRVGFSCSRRGRPALQTELGPSRLLTSQRSAAQRSAGQALPPALLQTAPLWRLECLWQPGPALPLSWRRPGPTLRPG